jgi:hypothetical protein
MSSEKYALYVIRRCHENQKTTLAVRVEYTHLPHFSVCDENSLDGDLNTTVLDEIEQLHKAVKIAHTSTKYHVYYILLGNNKFLAKAMRDALRTFFVWGSRVEPGERDRVYKLEGQGTKGEYLEITMSKEESNRSITPQMCMMGLRAVECAFRTLYSLVLPHKPKTVVKPSKIFSYVHQGLANVENFEFVQFGDAEDSDPEDSPVTKAVGAEIDVGTALDTYRDVKDMYTGKRSLEERLTLLQQQQSEKSAKEVTSERIKDLESKIRGLKKRRRDQLRKCLRDLTDAVKEFKRALVPEDSQEQQGLQ